MSGIDFFYKYHDEGTPYQQVSPEVIDTYKDILPEFLIEIWKTKGLSSFKDSFFWLVNPQEYDEIISFFMPNKPNLYVVMRTAFGGLIYLDEDATEKKCRYLCPIYRTVTPFTNRLRSVIIGWLTTEDIYAPLMLSNVYIHAREHLDAPKPDESYSFVPALALGGDLDPNNIKIAKTKAMLAFLSQLS